ncbi:M23 family metallopeptidase [Candidatus Berkelbacteria bacterium]|nr:M23 family metallopeptidase [Candidatus Berkelbacteria bacterium]MBI4029932.1 M23 family metallopeptidase [Candidatus Berkelbacteria bacterium]
MKYDSVNWGTHLGEDITTGAGTKVFSIGRGKCVYSALHPGNKDRRNWGNIIIIAHKNFKTQKSFFSIYGHLGKKSIEKGEKVNLGQMIGNIAERFTEENGWWGITHLHFAIYQGVWKGKVLPGYYKKSQKRTKLKDWVKPSKFIKDYQ